MFTYFLGSLLFLIILLFSPIPMTAQVTAQELSMDTVVAYQYFQEAQSICDEDNGKLWGISLHGPMLFADPQTRMIVANQSDTEGKLAQEGNVFVGRLPEKAGIGNTATFWTGVKWTMIVWPLPQNRYERASLMMHESWHRVQEEIEFPLFNSSSDHLDSREGRIWLQLEWRALREALIHREAERRKAIEDALIFRWYRRTLFTEVDSLERALEMSEGLAEYTGIKLSGTPDSELANYAAKQFEKAEGWETFVRSFAYLSGPAYGVLLDESGASWRDNLRPEDDLGTLLQESLSITIPSSLKAEAEKRSQNYGVNALRKAETERERHFQKRITECRARFRFVEGPVLILPFSLNNSSIDFKPTNLQPLGNFGTVYPTVRVASSWGILTVSNGALLTSDWTTAYVPAPRDPNVRPLKGDGWTLELDDAWRLEPAERKGDFILKKIESGSLR